MNTKKQGNQQKSFKNQEGEKWEESRGKRKECMASHALYENTTHACKPCIHFQVKGTLLGALFN